MSILSGTYHVHTFKLAHFHSRCQLCRLLPADGSRKCDILNNITPTTCCNSSIGRSLDSLSDDVKFVRQISRLQSQAPAFP